MSSYLRLVPLSLTMGALFFLSHQPGPDLPLPQLPGLDKILHALAYGILAATTLFAVPPSLRRSKVGAVAVVTVLFCLFYGLTDEFHQCFIPGREPSLADVAADTSGALLVAGVWYLFGRPAAPAGTA